jgi:hypothetical protein
VRSGNVFALFPWGSVFFFLFRCGFFLSRVSFPSVWCTKRVRVLTLGPLRCERRLACFTFLFLHLVKKKLARAFISIRFWLRIFVFFFASPPDRNCTAYCYLWPVLFLGSIFRSIRTWFCGFFLFFSSGRFEGVLLGIRWSFLLCALCLFALCCCIVVCLLVLFMMCVLCFLFFFLNPTTTRRS